MTNPQDPAKRAREVLADVLGYREGSAQRVEFLAGNMIPIVFPSDAIAAMLTYAEDRTTPLVREGEDDDITFMRREIDALFARTKGTSLRALEWNKRGHAILDAAAALHQGRDKAVEALRPFAKALDDWGDDKTHPDTGDLWEHPAAMLITVGDLRGARAALGAKGEGE